MNKLFRAVWVNKYSCRSGYTASCSFVLSWRHPSQVTHLLHHIYLRYATINKRTVGIYFWRGMSSAHQPRKISCEEFLPCWISLIKNIEWILLSHVLEIITALRGETRVNKILPDFRTDCARRMHVSRPHPREIEILKKFFWIFYNYFAFPTK